TIDADIFMGMVTAVETFVKDSVSQMQKKEAREEIGHMGYGNFHITNVPGRLLSKGSAEKGGAEASSDFHRRFAVERPFQPCNAPLHCQEYKENQGADSWHLQKRGDGGKV
ncbi:MAG: hypothetical protein QW115_02830, partial [Thermoplasmata archaeon]